MEDALAKRWTTEFPIGSTRDVIVAIRLPAATTTDQVRFIRLDVNLADGTPYEMTRRAFSQNATSSVQVEHPQLLRPMQAFPVQGDRIYMTLAVAGTRITQHQLGGRFDLAVTLENDTGDAPPYLAGSVEVLR